MKRKRTIEKVAKRDRRVEFRLNDEEYAIGLKNVEAVHLRGEEEHGRYDFVVSRAVMPLPDLLKIVRKNISRQQHNAIGNGVICLKGGNIEGETTAFRQYVEIEEISQWFEEEWFKEKYVVYLPV